MPQVARDNGLRVRLGNGGLLVFGSAAAPFAQSVHVHGLNAATTLMPHFRPPATCGQPGMEMKRWSPRFSPDGTH